MNDIQSTSREAFRDVKPKVGEKQYQVLKVIEAHADLTNTEIANLLNWPVNCVTPRVFELRPRSEKNPTGRGLIEEAEKRKCRVTGRTAIAWRRVRVSYQPRLM